jgi:LCP family protein required for cell wall assembly
VISEDTQPQSHLRPDTQPTQPGRAIRPAAAPRRARTPVGLVLLSGLLGAMVIACAACSLTLLLVGPERVLALRDQVLGNTPEQRVAALSEIIEVVVRGEDAWPIPNRGRLTILLMGVDRRTADGDAPARTDAITLITIDPQSKTAALLSVPRDLYVPLAGMDRMDRVNAAYFFGEVNHLPGGGAQAAKDTLAWNLGVPIDRHVVVDFNGFKRAIDALGGIDVNVPRRIVDTAYPTDNFGVETLVIEAGPTHMDGALALKYVRTRHQDSDFGRLQRQQQVMLAARDKLLSLGAIAHLPELLDAVAGSYETDLTIAEMVSIAKLWGDIPPGNIATYRIDQTMTQSWTTPSGASVQIPLRDQIAPVVAAFLEQTQ